VQGLLVFYLTTINKIYFYPPKNPLLNYTIYTLSTSSEWVTFIHGAGGSSSIWHRQLRAFKAEYNILLIDLRGHGKSKIAYKDVPKKKYTFDLITDDIIEVIQHLKIKTTHFVGVSMGSIFVRNFAENYPKYTQSMILSGAIVYLNIRSQLLMFLGNVFKTIIPYMLLYKFFAFIIMPKENHKESRTLFVREATKLNQKEFIRWFRLTAKINPLLRYYRKKDVKIPTLYVMGEEDYMFLPSTQKLAKKHELSQIIVVPNSGHVVNIEQPIVFNTESIQFLKSLR